jgi:hypothetical protein
MKVRKLAKDIHLACRDGTPCLFKHPSMKAKINADYQGFSKMRRNKERKGPQRNNNAVTLRNA